MPMQPRPMTPTSGPLVPSVVVRNVVPALRHGTSDVLWLSIMAEPRDWTATRLYSERTKAPSSVAASLLVLQPPHNTGNNYRNALLGDPEGNLLGIVAKIRAS